jgi:DNA-directed RNA polymerase specialized sigma24 family protein
MTSLADDLKPRLPRLRRFARALTGSQESGDAYVRQTLEAILHDPSIVDGGTGLDAALYRTFLSAWAAVGANNGPAAASAADDQLAALAPQSRQAFLLVALEGFNRETAAQIMGVDKITLDYLITEAGQDMAAQMATDVLIIEDEPLIAMDLENIVTSLTHNVIGVARTHTEALKLVETSQPGLILADIQLADGSSGLDAVQDLLRIKQIPVIFITAFPEKMLTGRRPEPTFLISKPFQPVMVRALISQALFFNQVAEAAS